MNYVNDCSIIVARSHVKKLCKKFLYKFLHAKIIIRPEPIMLNILPIILSRISQKILLLFFLLFLYPAYYSIIILIQYNFYYIYVTGRLVFKIVVLSIL